MHEHPILGAVLFLIGTFLITAAWAAGTAAGVADTMLAGHVLALNGALLAALGTGRHSPMALRNRGFSTATPTRR